MADRDVPVSARFPASPTPLARGDQVPHFEVTTIDGQRVRYGEFWQHRNLVLASIDVKRAPQRQDYIDTLLARRSEFAAAETELVISSDSVAGLSVPGIVVADKWGEIVQVFRPAEGGSSMPSADDLLEWVNFVRMQCPECPP